MSSRIYVGIDGNSRLARFLGHLAQHPTVTTAEVMKLVTQNARDGGTTELSGTRASFLVDLVGEAITGKEPHKEQKGVAVIEGVKELLLADASALQPALIPMSTELADARAQVEQLRAELKEARARVTVKADTVVFKGVEEHRVDDDGEVRIVFPSVPAVPAPKKNFKAPSWFEDMAAALDAGLHVSFCGPPGGGKSTAPEQYFIRKNQPFVVVNGDGGLRRRDLEGHQNLVGGGRSIFQVAEYAAAAVLGWGVILNEVNAAEADALLFINGQIEVPHAVTIGGRSYAVHKDFRLVVTYNHGLAGTKPLPASFKDRFYPIRLGFLSARELRERLVLNGMPEGAVYGDALVTYAQELWAAHERGELRYQITPRRLFQAVWFLERRPGAKINPTTVRAALNQCVIDAVDAAAEREVMKRVLGTKAVKDLIEAVN